MWYQTKNLPPHNCFFHFWHLPKDFFGGDTLMVRNGFALDQVGTDWTKMHVVTISSGICEPDFI